MSSKELLKDRLSRLFRSQRFAALATIMDERPYLNIVAFSVSSDLGSVFFATSKQTRKFGNLRSCGNVSLLIDNRSNDPSDFQHATAVTVMGEARELSGTQRDDMTADFLGKHPDLHDFIMQPETALMCVDVSEYYIVTEFGHVDELAP